MDSAPVFHPGSSKYVVITRDYLLPLMVCVAVVMLGWFALFSPYFRIAHINCTLDYQTCDNPALLAELDRSKGKNIFTLEKDKLKLRLIAGDYMIQGGDITKTLPDEISVDLQSVYPTAALKIADNNRWIILDKQLRVIGARELDPNVPTVVIAGPITVLVGKPLTDITIIKTLELAMSVAKESIKVKIMTCIDADTIELTLSDDLHALFTPKKDTNLQIRALQAILADATITKGMHVIDVRFSQPVLR